MYRQLVLGVAAVVATVFAAPAHSSQLLDRNAAGVSLAVTSDGRAIVTYVKNGRARHIVAGGAINALAPTAGGRQVRFRLRYLAGATALRPRLNACRAYDGPALPWFVAGCDAPDGSYWALQAWQRALPNLGFLPWLPRQTAWELHLSHWRGPLAQLEVWPGWAYRHRAEALFGRLTYRGEPVYGFRSGTFGAPRDRFGRLVFLDTFDSRYGSGWRRENSFLVHRPTGVFCYEFIRYDPFTGGYAHPPGFPRGALRGPGNGTRYRLTVNGPGVTPDIAWEGPGLHAFDPASFADVTRDRQLTALRRSLAPGDRCASS